MIRTHRCYLIVMVYVICLTLLGFVNGCATAALRVIVWKPYRAQDTFIKYVKISGQWQPAVDFQTSPPTQSNAKWGLDVKCFPKLIIDKSLNTKTVTFQTPEGPKINLVFSPKDIIDGAKQQLEKDSKGFNYGCKESILIQDMNVGFEMNGSGLGYWFPGFDVTVKLSLLKDDGKIVTTRYSRTILSGQDSNSFEGQSRETVIAGNAAVFEALAAGVNDLVNLH